MPNLRLLGMDNVCLDGSFEGVFEELRWLSWKSCPLEYMPSDFHPKKIVSLDMPFSNLRTWGTNGKLLNNLTILDVSSSKYLLTTPDFTGMPNLEELKLYCCSSLSNIHTSIGGLSKLLKLDIAECSNLEELPEQLSNLKSLRQLKAVGSGIKKLPRSIGLLESLEFINLVYCTSLEEFPKELGDINSLLELNLYGCKKLKSFSSDIRNLGETRLGPVPETMKDLKRMEYRDAEETSKSLPSRNNGWFKKLEVLDLGSCNLSDGNALDFVGRISSLRELKLSGNHFSCLPDLSKLKYLEKIYMTECNSGLVKFLCQGQFGLPSGCTVYLDRQEIPYLFEYRGYGVPSISFEVSLDVQHHLSRLIVWFAGWLKGPFQVHVINKTNGATWTQHMPILNYPLHSRMIEGPGDFPMKSGDIIVVSLTKSGRYVEAEELGVHLVFTKKPHMGGNSHMSSLPAHGKVNPKRKCDVTLVETGRAVRPNSLRFTSNQ